MGKKEVLSEQESRARLLGWARKYGAETDLLKLFARIDDTLRGAKTWDERNAIAAWGMQQIDVFFGGKGDYALQHPPPPDPLDLSVLKKK